MPGSGMSAGRLGCRLTRRAPAAPDDAPAGCPDHRGGGVYEVGHERHRVAPGKNSFEFGASDRAEPLTRSELATPHPDERRLEIVAPVDPLHAPMCLRDGIGQGLAQRVT